MIKKMFINKLNQLYKPKRILYYVDASEEDIQTFYKGVIPQSLEKYSNAFGTYDYPGIFFVQNLQKEVIGIEFRGNDSRIEYPADLKSIELEPAFFYSVEIASAHSALLVRRGVPRPTYACRYDLTSTCKSSSLSM